MMQSMTQLETLWKQDIEFMSRDINMHAGQIPIFFRVSCLAQPICKNSFYRHVEIGLCIEMVSTSVKSTTMLYHN